MMRLKAQGLKVASRNIISGYLLKRTCWLLECARETLIEAYFDLEDWPTVGGSVIVLVGWNMRASTAH